MTALPRFWSFPRKRESSGPESQSHPWTPAFAGVTTGVELSEILQAQHPVVVVISQDLVVAAPVDPGGNHPLRLLFRHLVLEVAKEPAGRAAGPPSPAEHA